MYFTYAQIKKGGLEKRESVQRMEGFERKEEVMTMNSKTVSAKGQGSKDRGFHNTMVYVRQHWQLYLIFLMPAFLLTLIFKYAPMSGILIAFQDYNPFKGVSGSEWVGFKHFTRFLSSPDFMRYLINTLKLSVYSLLWGFPVPIILALLLNRIQSSGIKKKIQLVLYLPNFVSVIVLCGIVRIFLSVTGPVNLLLGTDMNFMTMPEAFRSIYIISGIWQGAGWGAIIYIAALAGVSPELHESAVIDGANILQRIWHIDIPTILPTMIILLIMSLGNVMNVGYEKVYLMQNDLIADVSEIISTYVYKIGLVNNQFSFSTAIGLMNNLINFTILVAANKISNKIFGSGLW